MKRIVYSPAALSRLSEIAEYTWNKFGETQAEAYLLRLSKRVESVAVGHEPGPRSCELIMRGLRNVTDLVYVREASHYLIFRNTPDELQVVEIFHERMNLERHIRDLESR